jgi:hypothetical protein
MRRGTRRDRRRRIAGMAPRRKLPPDELREKLLGIKLNEEEHAIVHEAAQLESGRDNKMSDVFRPVVLRAARRIIKAKKHTK